MNILILNIKMNLFLFALLNTHEETFNNSQNYSSKFKNYPLIKQKIQRRNDSITIRKSNKRGFKRQFYGFSSKSH